jgi:hypothetical protein
MAVVADPEAVSFISEHGGRLYVYTDPAGKHVETEPPHDTSIRFKNVEADGFMLCVEADLMQLDDTWNVRFHCFPDHHVDVLWDGIFVAARPAGPPAAMSRDDFVAAVLAFLDQYIDRGAASDIRGVRENLRTNRGLRARLEDELNDGESTDSQAYDALHRFLQAEWERQGKRRPDPREMCLADLLADMYGDPAQWHDWLASVELGTVSDTA